MQIARGACNRRLCPLRTKSANASACIFLCLRSAPKRWFGTQSVRLFSQKNSQNPLSYTTKKAHLAMCFFRGGEGWIRTTEVTDNRFTVCSLWPLGNLSIGAGDRNRTNNLLITNQLLCLLSYTSVFSCWCLGADSNHRHRDFQSLALPPELPRHI